MKIKKYNNKTLKIKGARPFSLFPIPHTPYSAPYRGFTLIEMIVSVALFSVVMFVSVGALLAIADANRKANALRITMDNLNFAMESMSRAMRTGSGYSCGMVPVSPPAFGVNCLGGGQSFSFTDQNGDTVIYAYDSDKESVVAKKEGQSDFHSLTSPEINVEGLTFYVTGVGNTGINEGHQPRVVIVVKGKAGTTQRTQTSFNIQTTVSQRRVES